MSGNIDLLNHYFPAINAFQQKQLAQLEPLYREWNQRINVISRKDMEYFYLRHVLHSLAIARLQTFAPGTRILDVGTGGGFPGIPLAILFPEVEFTLIDSTAKKIKVVKAVAEVLELENCTAHHTRAEEWEGKYHYRISRAVAPMERFMKWTAHLQSKEDVNVLPPGIIYLKGGDLSAELKGIKHYSFAISRYFSESFFDTKKIILVPAL